MQAIQEQKDCTKAEEIDLPVGIVNFLQRRHGKKYEALQSRYSVTNIVGCQRKAFYKELGISEEELLQDTTVESMWASVRGDFLHEITRAYKWRELDIEHYVTLRDGKIATVAGRLDMYDWKTNTVIDLKTTKFVKWQIKSGFLPKPEHILQVQCYSTMFPKIMPVQNLTLVYADMNDLIAFKVQPRDLTEWIANRVQELEDSIMKRQPPKGELSGLCQFCKYQNKCYEDGNGIQVLSKQNSESKSLNNKEGIYQ